MSNSIANKITSMQQCANEEVVSIEKWYQTSKQKVLNKIEQLDTVYNERMYDYYAEWSKKLYNLYSEPEILETGNAIHILPPNHNLNCQKNMRSISKYADLWELSQTPAHTDDCKKEILLSVDQKNLNTTSAEQYSHNDIEYITNWYHTCRQRALFELEKIEISYIEKMAKNSAEWSKRLHQLYSEPDILETGSVIKQRILPIPKLTRQTNLRYLPEYAPLWKLPCSNLQTNNNNNMSDITQTPDHFNV